MPGQHDITDEGTDVYRQMWEGIDQDWHFEDIDDLENIDDWWSNIDEHDASATTTTTNDRFTPPPLRNNITAPPPRLIGEHVYSVQPSASCSREFRRPSPRIMNAGSSRLASQATSSRHGTTSQRRREGDERAGRSRVPEHSENWLDRNTTSRDSPSNYLFNPLWRAGAHPTARDWRSDLENGVDIDDFLDYPLIQEDDMPNSRRPRRGEPARDAVVDLTSDPSSPPAATTRQPTSLKRAAESSTQNEPFKRRRIDASSYNPATPIEELDLTNEAPSAEEELAQTQQAQLLQAQQPSTATSEDLKIGQRTCIICMEPFTNATITSCGHMYCHECLTQALIAGEKASEKGVGNCPVCRKPVKRNGKGNQIIPIAFMKKSAFKGRRTMSMLA